MPHISIILIMNSDKQLPATQFHDKYSKHMLAKGKCKHEFAAILTCIQFNQGQE